jgi:hypothetical protein
LLQGLFQTHHICGVFLEEVGLDWKNKESASVNGTLNVSSANTYMLYKYVCQTSDQRVLFIVSLPESVAQSHMPFQKRVANHLQDDRQVFRQHGLVMIEIGR